MNKNNHLETNAKPLSEEEIKEKLKEFPGWEHRDNKLIKQFEFKNFQDVLDFINKLAPICNRINHHPDIHIYFRKVTFELTRYSIGGKVSNQDFKLASEIEKLNRTWPR